MNGLFQKRFNSLQFPKGIVEILAGGESSTEPAVGGGGGRGGKKIIIVLVFGIIMYDFQNQSILYVFNYAWESNCSLLCGIKIIELQIITLSKWYRLTSCEFPNDVVYCDLTADTQNPDQMKAFLAHGWRSHAMGFWRHTITYSLTHSLTPFSD